METAKQELEASLVDCPECGYRTPVSFKRRKTQPRLCRNCGAEIAQPIKGATS